MFFPKGSPLTMIKAKCLPGFRISEPTVRRQTQAAGATYVALQTAQAEQILQHGPPEPCAPERLVIESPRGVAYVRGQAGGADRFGRLLG